MCLWRKWLFPVTQPKDRWSAITQLAQFRNDIAHPKPELVVEVKVLPEVVLEKTLLDSPKSELERQITVGMHEECMAP